MKELQKPESTIEAPTSLIDHYRLELDALYPNPARLEAFLARFEKFVDSDPSLADITRLDGNELSYLSESYIPPHFDPEKRTLAFILGNPAPESVAMEAMFAYEAGGKRYHRFWRVLHDTGLLVFPEHPNELTPHEKMQVLFSNNYSSSYNICILPFYSLASPPGGPWNGVAGLRRLFGEAFPAIAQFETERVDGLLDQYFEDGDTVVTFQKDAYEALQGGDYNYRRLLSEPLVARYATTQGKDLELGCLLPTRLLYSSTTKSALARLAQGMPLAPSIE